MIHVCSNVQLTISSIAKASFFKPGAWCALAPIKHLAARAGQTVAAAVVAAAAQ